MSFDMSQFYQVFFAEAGEHLDSMESLLLHLDLENPDSEQLNAIFRAAHSIKGSAGTFGFNDMAALTHVLEGVLDKLRKHELSLRTDMIDVFLAARDVLGNQLATHRDGVASDPAAAEAVSTRLQAFTAAPSAPAASSGPAITATPNPEAAGLRVRFILDGMVSGWARIIEALCAELASFGEVSVIEEATCADMPWGLFIAGADNPEGINDVLEFVARNDSVRIDSMPSQLVEDESFGLFEDAPLADADDGSFGFFVPESDETFGLFTDGPAEAASGLLADDGSYGLFEAPALASEPASAISASQRVANKAANNAEATIRVDVDKVDLIINQVGELVITQAMLLQAASGLDPIQHERLHSGLMQLERNSRDLQESVMSVRMMPISTVFHRFPRVVRDLSGKLGKQVELKMIGEATELDRGLIERIADPLTHLVRNSLDHGIEMPEQRVAAGKQAGGVITLKAYQQSGNIVIEVGDDGAGLNRSRILAKAKERGLPVSDAMSDTEVWGLIFEAGFSTAEHVTDVSGRGVGMDVVKRNIASMGGRVDIESMQDIGTRMTVRLPLTLAIVDGMSIAVGAESYIIPLGYVIESLQPKAEMIKPMGGTNHVIQIRDEYLPVIVLSELFGICDAVTDFTQGIMITLEANGQRAALFVDGLLGQHQVVIKSLEANYRKVHGIGGATIMGDGRVAFILDVVAIVSKVNTSVQVAA